MCFVIQPFDKGPFDKRFDDVIEPAIKAAGLEAYRVDRDASVSIPIEDIEKQIRGCEACLADISLDNPNVWYEVGFAIASGKDIILICSSERPPKFPFDVTHRNILTYTTHSPRDFTALAGSITARLKAVVRKSKTMEELSPIRPTKGLSAHETAAIILLVEGRTTPDTGVRPYTVMDDMLKAGFTKGATALALESLKRKKFIDLIVESSGWNNDQDEFYRVTEAGMDWCLANQEHFVMTYDPPMRAVKRTSTPPRQLPEADDDIPF